jgi:TRAP-type mannitol/chloroaromatic compound transport system permease small subunit
VLEGSPEGGNGIPAVFLLKTMILVFALLVALQGLSLMAKSWAVMTGKAPPPDETEAGEPGV